MGNILEADTGSVDSNSSYISNSLRMPRKRPKFSHSSSVYHGGGRGRGASSSVSYSASSSSTTSDGSAPRATTAANSKTNATRRIAKKNLHGRISVGFRDIRHSAGRSSEVSKNALSTTH